MWRRIWTKSYPFFRFGAVETRRLFDVVVVVFDGGPGRPARIYTRPSHDGFRVLRKFFLPRKGSKWSHCCCHSLSWTQHMNKHVCFVVNWCLEIFFAKAMVAPPAQAPRLISRIWITMGPGGGWAATNVKHFGHCTSPQCIALYWLLIFGLKQTHRHPIWERIIFSLKWRLLYVSKLNWYEMLFFSYIIIWFLSNLY